MIAAVELRTDPTDAVQLPAAAEPNAPALCADQDNPPDRLRGGLRGPGWRVDARRTRASSPGGPGSTGPRHELPGGRAAAAAAFAVDPDAGNCDGGAGDISGVMGMASPAITCRRGDPRPAADLRPLRRDRGRL